LALSGRFSQMLPTNSDAALVAVNYLHDEYFQFESCCAQSQSGLSSFSGFFLIYLVSIVAEIWTPFDLPEGKR